MSEYFIVTKGACQGKFTIQNKEEAKLEIMTLDISTGKPIQGTLLKLSTATRTMNVENLTNEEGKTEYITEGCGYYNLTVSREGYVEYDKQLCISKTSLANIVVPLIPIQNSEKTNIQICLSGDSGIGELSFKVYCPISIIYKK